MPDDVVTAADRAVNQPSQRTRDYGDRAVNQGALAAQSPGKKKKPPGGSGGTKATYLSRAKAELMRLHPGDALMQGVQMREWNDLPSAKIKATSYGAWTNSKSEIYLGRDVPKLSLSNMDHLATLRTILFHESVHIRQFDTAGSHPTKYATMMGYECAAYPMTVSWIDGELQTTKFKGSKALGQLRAVMDTHGKAFCGKIAATAKLKADAREREYHKFLIDKTEEYLPVHPFGTLPKLYTGP